jgi:dicarboxylate transporter 10
MLNIGSAGVAAMVASSCTHPLDVIKTRMQIIEGGSKVGMYGVGQEMLKSEGVKSL